MECGTTMKRWFQFEMNRWKPKVNRENENAGYKFQTHRKIEQETLRNWRWKVMLVKVHSITLVDFADCHDVSTYFILVCLIQWEAWWQTSVIVCSSKFEFSILFKTEIDENKIRSFIYSNHPDVSDVFVRLITSRVYGNYKIIAKPKNN